MGGRDLLREAFYGLVQRPVQSFLTALGIVFGVAAVIGMMAIGEGGRRQTLAMAKSLGLTKIEINTEMLPRSDPRSDEVERYSQGLRRIDGERLASISPDVTGYGASRDVDIYELIPRTELGPPDLSAVDEAFLANEGLEVVEGRLISTEEHEQAAGVAVLGRGAARLLFGREPSVGKMLRADGVWLRVVGVVTKQLPEGQEMDGFDQSDANRVIYIPLTTGLRRFDRPMEDSEVHRITLYISSEEKVIPLTDVLRDTLLRLHGGVQDFAILVPLEHLQQSRSTQRIFNLVMVLIASISLIVGGIGIMNVMLSSVLERTQEIGVRRAVGATRRDIILQFLAEAAVVSVTGGLLGTGLGYLVSSIVGRTTGWATAVSAWSVVAALGISVLVGIVFGWWPARRAAYLSPVEALRHD